MPTRSTEKLGPTEPKRSRRRRKASPAGLPAARWPSPRAGRPRGWPRRRESPRLRPAERWRPERAARRGGRPDHRAAERPGGRAAVHSRARARGSRGPSPRPSRGRVRHRRFHRGGLRPSALRGRRVATRRGGGGRGHRARAPAGRGRRRRRGRIRREQPSARPDRGPKLPAQAGTGRGPVGGVLAGAAGRSEVGGPRCAGDERWPGEAHAGGPGAGRGERHGEARPHRSA